MTGFALEVTLHWLATGLYIVATLLLAAGAVFGKDRARRLCRLVYLAGLMPHTAALALRWVESGHGPYILRYEVLSANAYLAVVGLLLLLWRRPAWSALGLFAAPVAIVAIAVGLFSNPQMRELPPTFRSVWLIFHISFAKVSAVSFLLSMASSAVLLLRQRPQPSAWMERAPAGPVLDALVVRFAGFGLIFWTVTIAAGSVWANQSWGRYWGWDAIETWSFVSWLIYGAFLHARLFFRTRPSVTAWMSIGAFSLFVLTALVIPIVLPSIHSAYMQ